MANNNSNTNLHQPLYEYLSQQHHPGGQRTTPLTISGWPHDRDHSRLLSPTHSLNSDHEHSTTVSMKSQHSLQLQQCGNKGLSGPHPASRSSSVSPQKEMQVGMLLNRFQGTSACSGAGVGAGGERDGNVNSRGSNPGGRTMDHNNNNQSGGGGRNPSSSSSAAVATSQSAPFNASTHYQQHPHQQLHHHPPPPSHQPSIQEPTPQLPNYQYSALLHDRLTAPIAASGGHNHNPNHPHQQQPHGQNPSGPSNHSVSSFSHSSAIPSSSRSRLTSGGGSMSSPTTTITSAATGGGHGESLKGMRSAATKVQLMNNSKHLMDTDLHSLMMGGHSHHPQQQRHNESLVDSTSPPPELMRSIYGGGGSASSSSASSSKRNYSPTQFAYLCDAVANAGQGAMTGSGGGGGSSNKGLSGGGGSGMCLGRSSSNGSSNCDSEKVSELLASMTAAAVAGGGGGMGCAAGPQGTEKKVPNSIRGEDEKRRR